jgi:hypothetical protein
MNLRQRTAALLQVVDAYRARRCAELIEAATGQARTLVRDALRTARGRVHTAIEEQRKRIAAEIGAAEARLATERRLRAQRSATATLAQAWEALRAALLARWRNTSTRARWVDAHLARALAALPRTAWQIRHPPDWPQAERDAVVARLAAHGIAAEPIADASIAAGLRVRAGNNALDFTLDGLLAERAALEGRLLQLLAEKT